MIRVVRVGEKCDHKVVHTCCRRLLRGNGWMRHTGHTQTTHWQIDYAGLLLQPCLLGCARSVRFALGAFGVSGSLNYGFQCIAAKQLAQ